jgi:hypothetical protein
MNKTTCHIKRLVLIALFGALCSAFKFFLMYIPNVEVVTLLIVVFTYVFGLGMGMGATIVFCVIEGLIWGFNPTWLVAYFIHWPTVSLVTFFMQKGRLKNPIVIAIIISAVTVLFGLQSTFTYMITGGGIKATNFVSRYLSLYTSGIIFYVVHVVSSFISVAVGFTPVRILLTKLNKRYLPIQNIG